ncbi:MAG: murein biosynthesis integral membrane protein MurJ [Anaerolineae bacterium]
MEQPRPRDGATQLLGAATLMSMGHVTSRLLGIVRERVIAGYFGTSLEASAFGAAARVPTMVYDLLIGGMLSAALVPVLASYAATKRDEFWRALSVLLSLAAVATGLIGLAVYAFAPQIARLLGPNFPAEGVLIVERSLRFIAPSVIAFGLAGTITGALYALERFSLPAAAGAAYNAVMITTVVLLHDRLGVYALAAGVSAGAVGQLLLLAPGLRDGKLRPLLDLRHPAVRRVLVLYAPIGLGLLVAQVQVWIDTRLASQAGDAALSVMRYGTQLIQFPHGFVAVAVSIAILPTLSASHALSEPVRYSRTLSRGIRLILALTLPAAVGLAVLAHPVVAAVYQHGEFNAASSGAVVVALIFYLVGLPFAAIDWPLNYASYARQDTLTPALVGVLSVLAYLAVAVALGPTMNLFALPAAWLFIGLVVADSAKHATHASVMLVITRRRVGPSTLVGTARTLVASGAAALVMGGVVLVVDSVLAGALPQTTLGWILRSGVGALVGAAVYLPLATRFGVAETSWLLDVVRRRLAEGGGGAAPPDGPSASGGPERTDRL